ncbi:MAG: hypothetical protein WAW39_16055 [Prosthecobacter sp.]|uniref:hypothetical protein n=1 Tax=Prosthecobacter sp. TaxID=1965333 RepID=UPI003BB06D32
MKVEMSIGGDALRMLEQLEEGMINRADLHQDIATREENLVRDYLISLAQTRHATADDLGATPTGHLERAAESVTSRSDADAATVSITSPGMRRAFEDITIVPVNAKWLTIAATAEAYGKRAGAFNDLRLAFFKGGRLALVKADQSRLSDRKSSGYGIEGKAAKADATKQRPPVYYWLVKSVTQKQDRTLLPSDALLQTAAEEGVRDWLKSFLAF